MRPGGRRVVVAGGGFAGLWAAVGAAAAFEQAGVEGSVTLVNRDPWLTIRPRLYERAPENLQVPLGPVLDEIRVRLEVATIASVDLGRRVVLVGDDGGGARELAYDALVLATGSRISPAPTKGAATNVYDVDSPAGAERLWARLAAPGEAPTVAVVGGGLTGMEVATEIATERDDARVLLLDAASEVAASYEPMARAAIQAALYRLGVEVRSDARVTALEDDAVVLKGGERLRADLVVWCAGFEAAPLEFAEAPGRDSLGRVVVLPDLAAIGHEGVYAAGDAAVASFADGRTAPMSCQLAIPMGKTAGRNAAAHLLGAPTEVFAYDGYVTCLDLGGAGAVFTLGWQRRLELSDAEGKARKQLINHRLIYPPRERAQLLEAGGRGTGAAATIERVAARS